MFKRFLAVSSALVVIGATVYLWFNEPPKNNRQPNAELSQTPPEVGHEPRKMEEGGTYESQTPQVDSQPQAPPDAVGEKSNTAQRSKLKALEAKIARLKKEHDERKAKNRANLADSEAERDRLLTELDQVRALRKEIQALSKERPSLTSIEKLHVDPEIEELRASLTPEELERYRQRENRAVEAVIKKKELTDAEIQWLWDNRMFTP